MRAHLAQREDVTPTLVENRRPLKQKQMMQIMKKSLTIPRMSNSRPPQHVKHEAEPKSAGGDSRRRIILIRQVVEPVRIGELSMFQRRC